MAGPGPAIHGWRCRKSWIRAPADDGVGAMTVNGGVVGLPM
jgi:hypothetical protein